MSAPDGRAAYISGLRRFADLLERHPEIPLPWTGTGTPVHFHFVLDSDGGRQGMDGAARLLGASWGPDETYGDDPVYVRREGRLDGLLVGLIRYAGPGDGPGVTP